MIKKYLGKEFRTREKSAAGHGMACSMSSSHRSWEEMTPQVSFSSSLTKVSSISYQMPLGKFLLVAVVDFFFPNSYDTKPQIKAISTNIKVAFAI